MKYIRTKDGIYKYVKKIRNYYYECDGFIDDEKKVHCFIVFKPKDILKKADTIKELCDCYILIQENGTPVYINANEPIHELLLGDRKLYGAIWTDKGLIYVTKLNEKGELELL